MTLDPAGIYRFADKQKRLLRRTYDEAWQRGVDSYEPDSDPTQTPTLPRSMATTGLTGAALLAALRRYPYEAPVHPDAVRRAIALRPSFRGINGMVRELAVITTGESPHIRFVREADSTGDWADSNAWRLDGGDSVAWAGEQAGFAEAATADGQFLYQWINVGDVRVCNDCELMGSFPPMLLSDWPTSPGAGDTECSVGCRCSWDTFDIPLPADYSPDLTPDQAELVAVLAQRQSQALADMIPDAAYLE